MPPTSGEVERRHAKRVSTSRGTIGKVALMNAPPKPWPTGLIEQPEPLVRRVLAPNPSPYTYTGTQTYLVGNAGTIAVIDPGPDDARHLAALEAAIGDAKIGAIMCTHTHRDHSPAAKPLAERTGAPIVGCAPLVFDGTLLDDWGPRVDAPFDNTYAPDRVLADGESMTGPGWTLTAVATPGHTSNHLCFALEESGALFTGDHVMGWSTSVIVPPDGDMADYMASLAKLYEREDRVYYSAHGAPIEKPRQLVRGMMGHRRQRENQILRLLGESAQTIEALVPQMYKGLDPRLFGAAGMSVKAHLIDLERRGMVVRSKEKGRSEDIWQTS
jgi:glyoxylase-like metal-dependent hydrolase (beta-lactamase superfamily II)